MYFINKENNEVSTAVSDKAYDNTDGKFLNVDMTKVQNDVAEALLINIDYRKTEADIFTPFFAKPGNVVLDRSRDICSWCPSN